MLQIYSWLTIQMTDLGPRYRPVTDVFYTPCIRFKHNGSLKVFVLLL